MSNSEASTSIARDDSVHGRGEFAVGERSCGVAEPPVVVVLSYDHSLIELMRSLLNEVGFEIHADAIRASILPTILRLRPSALIVDVGLGHESEAWELVMAIRHHAETHLLPIIACAAASWLLEKQSPFLERHSVSTWTAPFNLLELLRTFASVLPSIAE